MPRRPFCCDDLPPKGLAFSMATIAVLLGLGALALGYEWVSLGAEFVRAPRWMVIAAGVMFICGGVVISLVALPTYHRRERSHQV